LNRVRSKLESKTNPVTRGQELRAVYYSLVEMIVQGRYEDTARGINELRKGTTHPDAESIRRLVAVRLAIKRGDPGEDTSWITLPIPENSWLEAERSLVRGHWEYHLKNFKSGITHFRKAEQVFGRLRMYDREYVSSFNAIIGEVSGPTQLAPLKQLDALRELEGKVRLHIDDRKCLQVQAMIHRQKAHAFEDLNRLHASLEEISKAIAIFEVFGPTSDYHLALLHAADISLDLNDSFRGRSFMEYVIEPVDARIEFPLAYVRWRLGGPLPDQKRFAVVPGGWKEKFEKLEQSQTTNITASDQQLWDWNFSTGRIESPDGSSRFVLKPSSLEARLLKLLMQERSSKQLLIEALWPSQGETQLLDNRFHRMISRLNRKLKGGIEFDGKHYHLRIRVKTR